MNGKKERPGQPGYTMRLEDVGKRPIKVRVRNKTHHPTFFVWRCRYCNKRGNRYATAAAAADAGQRHYWERCVTLADLDVLEARRSPFAAFRVPGALRARSAAQRADIVRAAERRRKKG